MMLNSSGWAFIQCVNRSYHLPLRLQRNTRTSITQCLVNSRKYTSRRNPSIGKTPLVCLNSSTCIAIAKSIHKMHVTIFHVGKHKRHFSNTIQLTCHPFPKQPYTELRMQCTQRISYAVKFSGLRQLKSRHTKLQSRPKGEDCDPTGTVRGPARKPHFSLAIISVTVPLDIGVLGYIGIL